MPWNCTIKTIQRIPWGQLNILKIWIRNIWWRQCLWFMMSTHRHHRKTQTLSTHRWTSSSLFLFRFSSPGSSFKFSSWTSKGGNTYTARRCIHNLILHISFSKLWSFGPAHSQPPRSLLSSVSLPRNMALHVICMDFWFGLSQGHDLRLYIYNWQNQLKGPFKDFIKIMAQ